MNMTMNFYQKKVFKIRAWKACLAFVGVALISQQTLQTMPKLYASATGAVCPAGDVKLEVGGGYEYTDNSATITMVSGGATWTVAPGFVIDSVCVKIGGPGGGSLIYPTLNGGPAGPYQYGISHVVITTHRVSTNQCELTITKSVNATTAQPGDLLTYTINYQNVGQANCTGGGVRIDDLIPAGTTYTGTHSETTSNDTGHDGIHYGYQSSGFGSGANNSLAAGAAKLSWNANVVSPGESGLITFVVQVNPVDLCTEKTITNIASIASDQTYPPALMSNSVATEVATDCAGTLKVIKQVVGGDLEPAAWQLTVSHNGQAVDNSPQAGSATGTIYALPVGTYAVTETGPDGYLATYSDSCPNGQAVVTAGTETVCAVTNTKIVEPNYAISLEKTGPATIEPGQLMTYTLAWDITGDDAVTAALVSDTVPANTSFETASCGTTGGTCTITENNGVVTWDLGSRQPGDHGTVELTVKTNSVLANGLTIPNAACFDTAETNQVCDEVTTTVVSTPTITLDKQGPGTVTAGQNVTYTLQWTVSGNAPVTNAVITDPLPANTTFISADHSGNFANNVVSWNLGSKNPGDSGTVSVTVKAASPLTNGTVLTNTACFDTAETNDVCDTVTTTVESAPQLSIVKSNDIATFATPGQTVLYTVTVANAAGATDSARDVMMTDVLPAGFTYTVGGGTTKSFPLGTIAPGSSVTTTYTALISASQAAGTFTNTASAQGSNTGVVSATSAVEVRVPQVLGLEAQPTLTITKSVTPTTTNPGKTVRYTLKVTNTSTTTATNLVITDTLPAGFTFVEGGSRTMTWKTASLEAGKSISIPYQVRVGQNVRAGKYVNVATVIADDVSQQEAKRSVTVVVPQVLGLATTGVSTRDYLTMVLGLLLIATGAIWYNRMRSRYGTNHI